jgi:hypothetical protein
VLINVVLPRPDEPGVKDVFTDDHDGEDSSLTGNDAVTLVGKETDANAC